MSGVWPLDVKNSMADVASSALRPFEVLLLMPFERRFDPVADIIRDTVLEALKGFDANQQLGIELPRIERLDWVKSTGVVQQEIWEKIAEADLVFCDITGFNPNVMFESGVCAAWKEMVQVIFIKDHFFKQEWAFDIAPIRHIEYQLTTEGLNAFQEQIVQLTRDVLIGFPDRQGNAPLIELPIEIDFENNRDDLRIYTPPYSHRRMVNGTLEFGSLHFYSYSWASLGKKTFHNFDIQFTARFSNPLRGDAWIGVGLRSQHYYANYSHLLYLNGKGLVVITEPNEDPPRFYEDNHLRPAGDKDMSGDDHNFSISFDDSILRVQVDDFPRAFHLKDMKKVLGPGLIRFQSWGTWMAIKQIKVTELN